MAEDEQEKEVDGDKLSLIAKIKSDKKLMIMVGGGALLLFLLIGGAVYYFLSGDEKKGDVPTEETTDPNSKETLGEGDGTTNLLTQPNFEQVYMYPLKSFFFPIKLKNKENSGRFLLVTPSFSMSNSGLGTQVSKNLPKVRKRIYNILLRETYTNLTTKTESTKKRVKKRIITKINELLPVGTGVVQQVYFSEFIIK